MPRFLIAWILAVGTVASVSAAGLSPQEKFFEREVRPLLIERCHECHGDSLQESDLRLDSLEAVLQGGISGPAAIAGNVDESLLLRAVLGKGVEQMPPDEPLEAEQIAVLRRWIRMGMPWTPKNDATDRSGMKPEIALGDQEAIGRAAKNHWAFQPVADVAPPTPVPPPDGTFASWGRNPIDAFIWRKLQQHRLHPSRPADRATLLRRLSFDIVGLPPTADEIDYFREDSRPDSVVVAEAIERLLASEHYGERWARYWLDVARYADTRDWQAQADLRYPFAYTYRDYVIRSLNDDKPYDQFIREQIAADFFTDDPDAPELAALGFLTVGPRFRNNRLEQAADKIDVVCRGVMGLTVACARCHDHKYDPVPIEDYYSLYGVFASSEIPDKLPQLRDDQFDRKLRAEFQQALSAKKQELADYQQQLRREAVETLTSDLPIYLEGFYRLSVAKSQQVRGVIDKLELSETAITPLDRTLSRRLRDRSDQTHPVLGPWQQALSVDEKVFKKSIDRWLREWQSGDQVLPIVAQHLSADAPDSRHALVQSYAKLFEQALSAWQEWKQEQPNGQRLPDDQLEQVRQVLMAEDGGWFDLDVDEVTAASRLFGKGRKILGDFEKAITEVKANHPGSPPRAMVIEDAEQIVNPFVLLRGEPNRRGDRVPRQFPAILAGDDRAPFVDGSGRRELAEAMTAPDNPLTSRVIVNRVWARYFGRGLATSLDDFGLRSDPPTHPELLDFLASQFVENGWSLKWLHRMITTSQTYAQSSQMRQPAFAADPENQWFWRQNRRRLDFEAMRDSMLAVSGQLDPQLGGRSVHLSEQPFTRRRTVYAYVDRVEMDPILRTFDFASPTSSAASRAETTIPQQALFSMNHPFVAQMARGIAEQVAAAERSLPGDQVSQGETGATSRQVIGLYRQVFGRQPSATEQQLAEAYLRQAASEPQSVNQTWSYGWGAAASDDGTDPTLHPLPFWTGKAYQPSEAFPDPVHRHARLTAAGGHPGIDEQHAVIRRWRAPADGIVRVTGSLRHSRENGDGVTAVVRHQSQDKRFHAQNREIKTVVPPIQVQKGQVIDLAVAPGPTTTADAFIWQAVILGIGGDLAGQRWESQQDFGPPPPPPLEPLAQLAQALLLTNEFLFVD
ncbi:DUF1553 domain-containing protein [Roseiconus nitratireducens]|uniref:DUF1553 domain-containing protein n=1 Tax=Roseiconus nitratireducens TaxID=2605748 RepID=A0A5M6DM09_9BACT|nr:PSD1 and planctomycete cytochrome C domain-containing protein [Roseiconus nitratireducens]KAA5547160.1 DUF1553 domain-containing protein [Roseiconus nitratireducens]